MKTLAFFLGCTFSSKPAGPYRRRASVVAAQHPKAAILTCSDSRVSPEYVFNEGIGDLFVVRVAGVVADPVVVGSVEYAAGHLHVPLVVVMGHTRCGAVKAALDTPAPPPPGGPGANIEAILSLLRPGVAHPQAQGDPWRAAVFGGVEASVADLFKLSKMLPEMDKAGEVGVVGAGQVVFSDMVKPDHSGAETHGDRLVQWARDRQLARLHTGPALAGK